MTGETACESEGPIKVGLHGELRCSHANEHVVEQSAGPSATLGWLLAPLRLPTLILLQLNLSNPPSSQTHDAAHAYLHRPVDNGPSPDELLYRQIMSEPFTGAHWGKGYDEEVKHGWTDSESSSGDSDVEVVTPSTGRIRSSLADRAGLRRLEDQALQRGDEQRLKAAEETLRAFKEHAYWRQGGGPIESLETDLYGWRALTTRESRCMMLLHLTMAQEHRPSSLIQPSERKPPARSK